MARDATADRVLDAAEDRLRRLGFHGTSFRDLAADVGIKSASVHYHFPTKADLGRAVTERYTERFLEALGDPADPNASAEAKLSRLIEAFAAAARGDPSMCLCGLLATERDGLPEPVANGTAAFFDQLIAWTRTALGDGDRAVHVIAVLEGALLVAHALGDVRLFETAAAPLRAEPAEGKP